MKNNSQATMVPPHQINPLTQLWNGLTISQIMNHQIPRYVKLGQIQLCK